ncbi:MAG TPA: NB-ARC domain-containing protein [Candidatus Limnocylindrales bacterium]|nr:NB-ARC domain-containing protein [Candidatus Limnocylindrales bacterium]
MSSACWSAAVTVSVPPEDAGWEGQAAVSELAYVELLAQLCQDLRLMWINAGGPTLQVLGNAAQLSKSQVGAILNGDIRQPPDWTVIKRLVLRIQQQASQQSGRTGTPYVNAGIDEYWWPRYNVVAQAFSLAQESRRPGVSRRRERRPPGPSRSHLPCLLPPAVGDFTGREEQVQTVTALLAGPSGEGSTTPAVTVVVIAGSGGVGKTTLAVHCAHLQRPVFPDGQLYVDLGGVDDPVDPADVLARFLGALGMDPAGIPNGQAARQEIYRNRVAGRRILVVLDNACDESHIEALLPGTNSCAVVVTSRHRHTTLPGAKIIELEAFTAPTALRLLAAIAGPERIGKEHDAALRVAELCGGLPLAVRAAGARLATKTHWTVNQLATRLADEHRRLDELSHRHLAVRASIGLSYQDIDPLARRLLRLLSLVTATDTAAWVSARLLDLAPADAEDVLERLVDARLLEVVGVDLTGQTRYRLHDLIRLFARERAMDEDGQAQRTAALGRMLGTWLDLIQKAAARAHCYVWLRGSAPRWPLDPQLTQRLLADPLAWFDGERLRIPSVIHQAADGGHPDLRWEIALATSNFYSIRNDFDTGIGCLELGLDHARRLGNEPAAAMLLILIGSFEYRRQRYDQASTRLQQARHLTKLVQDKRLFGLTRLVTAHVMRDQAQYDTALHAYREAHKALQPVADPIDLEAVRGIGRVLFMLGHTEKARPYLQSALQGARRLGNKRFLWTSLCFWGELALREGRLDLAEAAFMEMLRTRQCAVEATQHVAVMHGLGRVRFRQGRHRPALAILARAAKVGNEAHLRVGEARALAAIAEVHHHLGQLDKALTHINHATTILRSLRSPHYLAMAMQIEGRILTSAGQDAAAKNSVEQAASILNEIGVSHRSEGSILTTTFI